ncbi:MAG: iron ABC transporter permease [Nitrospirales bacterium]
MALVDIAASGRPWVRRLKPRMNGMTLITGSAVVLLLYLLIVPLAVQIFSAFRGPATSLPFESTASFTLSNIKDAYTSGGMKATIIDTSYFVGGSVLVSLVIGFALAWLIERTDLPYRRMFFVLILMPAIMPGLVRAQAWLIMLAPKTGIFNQSIRWIVPDWLIDFGGAGPINPFSFPGMILVQGLGGATFFFLLLSAVLRNMDGGLEEASATSGASPLQTLRRVTAPILLPGILAVVMLNVIITVGQFEVPLLFGIGAGANIFSLRIWLPICCGSFGLPEYGVAAAYALNFLAITYLLFILYSRLTRQANKFATVTGKGYRPTRLRLGRLKYVAYAGLFGYLTITFVIPLIVLLWASLFPFYFPMTWDNLANRASLDSYRVVLNDAQFWGGLWRTFVVASLSATIAVGLSMIIAWAVVRGGRGIVNRILDLFASSSVAIPATVAAFAFFMFYIVVGKWIPIYGTIWILVLAYSFRISVAYRNSYAGILQINRELEEASATSGASQLATFRRILLPLLLPHAMAAWLLLFLLGSHEFTIAVFLADADSNTLPVVLYNRLSSSGGGADSPPQAAAMGVMFTILVAALAFFVRWFVSRRGIRQEGMTGG